MPWLILMLGVSRCSVDRAAIRSDEQEQKHLQDSAEEYWHAVRWGYAERAAVFVEQDVDRSRHHMQLEAELETQRYTDVTVLRVTVTAPEDPAQPDANGHWRTGEVVVFTEGYTLPAQIVQRQERTQQWYRTTDGWFVSP